MDHRIVSLPAFTVVGLEYIARSPNGIGPLWERFLPREHEIGLRSQPGVSYGVCAPLPDGVTWRACRWPMTRRCPKAW